MELSRRKFIGVAGTAALGIAASCLDTIVEAAQNDNYVLAANFTELIKRHPSIEELAVKYDFRFNETKDASKAQEKGTSAWTALYPNTELNSILYADSTIYTGRPFEFYRDGAKIAVPQRTGPMIKTDLIHEVLEAEEVQRQLLRGINFDAIDRKLAHRNATAKQLEFDVGLNIEEFLHVYAAHIEAGGLRYPGHLPVNGNGVVETGKIKWNTLKNPVSIGQLEGNSMDIPYVQNGVRKTGTLYLGKK